MQWPNLMQTLIDLVKLGAIGASLAFLLLSFWLLTAEQRLKDANKNPHPPRPEILKAIRRFGALALVFLIVGVASEFFLSHGTELIAAAYQMEFKNDLVRVRFNDWEYAPEKKLIGFGFEQNGVNTTGYVLPALKSQYDVYVGVRAKSATPFDHGEYKIIFGPFRLDNQSRLDQTLTPEQISLLGPDCVEFTAFGIPKIDGKTVAISLPFDPDKFGHHVSAFNTAGVCTEPSERTSK